MDAYKVQDLVTLIFKAISLAMAVASVVISILGAAPVQVNAILLGLGLLALAVASLSKPRHE